MWEKKIRITDWFSLPFIGVWYLKCPGNISQFILNKANLDILSFMLVCACMLGHFCHVQLLAMLWTVSGSFVHGTLQARILEWVDMLPPEDLPHPGIEPATLVSCVGRWVLHH